MRIRRLLPVFAALAATFAFTNAASAGEPFHPIVSGLGNFFRMFWF